MMLKGKFYSTLSCIGISLGLPPCGIPMQITVWWNLYAQWTWLLHRPPQMNIKYCLEGLCHHSQTKQVSFPKEIRYVQLFCSIFKMLDTRQSNPYSNIFSIPISRRAFKKSLHLIPIMSRVSILDLSTQLGGPYYWHTFPMVILTELERHHRSSFPTIGWWILLGWLFPQS